ncbi:MAG: SMP-30/gluconolactonase/LRE family protein [Williamsia sp.]|nr:SMP-30/gluconolactonase/LRE family protein [Williamsia sp.]
MNRQTIFTRTIFTILIVASCIACEKDDNIQVSQSSYTIPGNTFFPEGIAYDDNKGVFYTGSVSNGDIVQVNVQTGASVQFAAGAAQGRAAATGMKLDAKGRLWVCGGSDNKIHVLNPDGSLLKSWNLSSFSATGFINDCVLDNNYVYFTDSQNKQIYRTSVSVASPGDVERWLTFTDQQIPYAATGTNANGIVMTPSGNYLIIVVSSSGKLYRIDISSKNIVEITLNTTVLAGDGLLLDKNILYVSRNSTNQIFPVTLNPEFSQGTVGTGFGDNLLFNTTMAKAGNYLLVVNGQLNRRTGTTPPTLPFTVSRVSIP